MNKVLGLDVSTSCVGAALIADDGTYRLEHLDLSKIKNMCDKADAVRSLLASMKCEDVTRVFIEDAAMKFASGRSSAQVIATLLRFNGIVSYISWEEFGLKPEYIAPQAARKALGMKMQQSKKCGKSHKQQAFEFVTQGRLTSHVFPVKKSGDVVDWAYDEVDAYVVAAAGQLLNTQP